MGGFVAGIDVGGAKVALAAADLAGHRFSAIPVQSPGDW
jgi:hypothetical protein